MSTDWWLLNSSEGGENRKRVNKYDDIMMDERQAVRTHHHKSHNLANTKTIITNPSFIGTIERIGRLCRAATSPY